MQDMMLMVNYFLGFPSHMNSMLWSMVIFLILTSGVPEVSVPGSLLFTIIHQRFGIFHQQHMVATFIVAIKFKFDVEQLQGDIDALMKWSKLWILSFNISKSKLETLVIILILIYFHTNNCVLKANCFLSVITKSLTS